MSARLEKTGSLAGPGAWRWGRLGRVTLDSGEHVLRAFSGFFRVDAFYLTRKKGRPPSLRELATVELDAETKEKLADSAVPITPEWLEREAVLGYELPEWYDDWRVHAHTRLGPGWRDRELFLNAADAFKRLGFHAFVRHIKSGNEGAWGPTEHGRTAPWAKETNYAKKIIQNAHQAGRRIIVYHRHMEDRHLAERHPSWVTRGPDGKPFERRGKVLCMNSPYPKFVKKRLVELAEMGADGFYFDEMHMPPGGCWCPHTRKAFRRATGLKPPETPNPYNPVYQRYLDFQTTTIENTFRRWLSTLHERFPKLVSLISSYKYPGMTSRHSTHRLYRLADAVKTEFDKPLRIARHPVFKRSETMAAPEEDAALALGYTIARDAAGGRPPHVWVWDIAHPTQAVYATAGLITHGAIANLDNREGRIPNHELFDRAVSLGNRVSPALDEARPMRWAAVHFPEHARNHYLPDAVAAWKEVLYPTYGAFTTLLRERMPVGIVTDSQLEQGLLDRYEVLFLPAPGHLTDRMERAVEEFKQSGGQVIRQRKGWRWHQPGGGMESAGAALLKALRSGGKRPPVTVSGGNERMHAVPFVTETGGRLTVSLVNDFSWVREHPDEEGDKLDRLVNRRTPEPCTDVTVRIRRREEPLRVYNAATGKDLETRRKGGVLLVRVPTFQTMAVVVAKYGR